MGLFDKKFCDICGEKIGLLGNRKLEDGNMCKTCARKLSPWFSDRKSSTIAEINEQLAYRTENQEKLAQFHVTRTLGTSTKLLFDEDAGAFVLTDRNDLVESNPDIIRFEQLTGADLDIDERRTEIMAEDKDGKKVSYNPRRFKYEYDFKIIIHVDHPYFNEMDFRLNPFSIDGNSRRDYERYKELGDEIVSELSIYRASARAKATAQNAPKAAVTCPHCGATTLPDGNGCCEYCGGSVNG